MENVSIYTNDALNSVETAFIIVALSANVAMIFWSIYLINEILLARKRLKYSIKYIIDGSISTIKRKCKTDIWKNALLLLICISESLSILFGGLSIGTGFNLLKQSVDCDNGFSLLPYQLVLLPAATMLLATITFSLLNIITVFFIGIYSYHTEKNNHKKLLVFLCIQTSILIPILLIPYTVVYGMFICICLMVIFSYKWCKNTQRLLLYLKWRFEDMRDECPLSANQIRVMRNRYRQLIYILIFALQPGIVSLLFKFLYEIIGLYGNNCTQYYTLQYLDQLLPSEVITKSMETLEVLIILTLAPVTIILLIPYVVYTVGYMVRIVLGCTACKRRRNVSILTQSLLKY